MTRNPIGFRLRARRTKAERRDIAEAQAVVVSFPRVPLVAEDSPSAPAQYLWFGASRFVVLRLDLGAQLRMSEQKLRNAYDTFCLRQLMPRVTLKSLMSVLESRARSEGVNFTVEPSTGTICGAGLKEPGAP